MNPGQLISTLEANADVFHSLFNPVANALIKWRPPPTSWNLLEIVCHLRDEETGDFRERTSFTLRSGKGKLKPVSPVLWMKERNYASSDYMSRVESFIGKRKNGVIWLRSLEKPNWDASFNHPGLGTMTAWSMQANWVAHDFHRIRQVTAIKYEFLRKFSGENLSYAGNWKP